MNGPILGMVVIVVCGVTYRWMCNVVDCRVCVESVRNWELRRRARFHLAFHHNVAYDTAYVWGKKQISPVIFNPRSNSR